MKNFKLFLLFSLCATNLYSQQTDLGPTLTKQDYLKKSKSQNTAGWIIGGTGVVLIGVGLVVATTDAAEEFVGVFDPEVNDGGDSGTLIGIAGLVAVGCSVPLFLAAEKNRKKAISLSFQMQHLPKLQNTCFTKQSIPSLSLKITL